MRAIIVFVILTFTCLLGCAQQPPIIKVNTIPTYSLIWVGKDRIIAMNNHTGQIYARDTEDANGNWAELKPCIP